jgi:acetyl esterase/lipase
MMLAAFGAASLLALAAPAAAQEVPQKGAPSGAVAIPLYGKSNPGKPSDDLVFGPEGSIRNVTYPTLIPVLPRPGTANGTAVIVAPGGGFMFLSMESEGWAVARALADRGVTAFVLKYRLTPTPADDAQFQAAIFKLITGLAKKDRPPPKLPDTEAGQDALAALKLVRTRAKDWQIDPKRVGMIGFSAGAITTLKAVLDAGSDADAATLPPDFFGYIYGPMDAVAVPADAPPMFAALAMDDTMFSRGGYEIVGAWRDARRPVELHVYQTGGHGFGLGKPGQTNALLMPEFLAWMEMQGLLKAAPQP